MVVAGEVQEDGMEPGINRGTALKPMNRPEGLKKRFLNDVLRVGCVPA